MATRGRPRKNPLPPEAIQPHVVKPVPVTPEDKVLVICIKHDVALGDERSLAWQESAWVAREVAEFLEARGQVRIG